MNLEHLRTFEAVARLRHFAKAAAQRNLSQPAVSHQIAQLEESLGTRLFNRRGRTISVTVVGQILLEEVTKVLSTVDRAEERVREAARGSIGRIRMGASPTAGLYVLPELISGYRASHPNYGFRLEILDEPTLLDMVTRNDLDMAVLAGEMPTADLQAAPLVSDELIVVSAEPMERGTTYLRQATWILREKTSDTRRRTDEWMDRNDIAPAGQVTLNGPDAVKRAIMSGLGIGALSRRCVEAEIETGLLHEVPLARKFPQRTFAIVDHRQKHHGVACRAMLGALDGLRRGAEGT